MRRGRRFSPGSGISQDTSRHAQSGVSREQGQLELGSSCVHVPSPTEASRDPQGDYRKRYKLVWKGNLFLSYMKIRAFSQASVVGFGPSKASALSPLGPLSWSVASALWPSYCRMNKGQYHRCWRHSRCFPFAFKINSSGD